MENPQWGCNLSWDRQQLATLTPDFPSLAPRAQEPLVFLGWGHSPEAGEGPLPAPWVLSLQGLESLLNSASSMGE